jgi:CheY-like chemotaxis protein
MLTLLEARPEIGLLFIDVRMPGMSGPELANLVRQRRNQAASIAPQRCTTTVARDEMIVF